MFKLITMHRGQIMDEEEEAFMLEECQIKVDITFKEAGLLDSFLKACFSFSLSGSTYFISSSCSIPLLLA
jgi:hypothetical protein